MYRCLFVLLLLVFTTLSSCRDQVDETQVVAHTAQLYYEALLQGRYEEFVGGLDSHVGVSASYTEQLTANAKMFLERQRQLRDGIKHIAVSDAQIDKAQHTANVFLVFSYGDGTSEQVLVPMVERDGVWLMR